MQGKKIIKAEVIALEQSSKLFDAKKFGEKWGIVVERLQFQVGRMENKLQKMINGWGSTMLLQSIVKNIKCLPNLADPNYKLKATLIINECPICAS